MGYFKVFHKLVLPIQFQLLMVSRILNFIPSGRSLVFLSSVLLRSGFSVPSEVLTR